MSHFTSDNFGAFILLINQQKRNSWFISNWVGKKKKKKKKKKSQPISMFITWLLNPLDSCIVVHVDGDNST